MECGKLKEMVRILDFFLNEEDSHWRIVIKLSKIKFKENILKAAREKQQITYKGIPIRLTADLSAETLQARREWQSFC